MATPAPENLQPVQTPAPLPTPAPTPEPVPMGITYKMANGALVLMTAAEQAVYDADLLARQALAAEDAQRRITPFAFRSRFTAAEKVAIELACLDNPGAKLAARQQAATLRVAQQDIATAPYVNLDHPDTRARVQALEQAGLLAHGRALQVLDAPVEAFEQYRGAL